MKLSLRLNKWLSETLDISVFMTDIESKKDIQELKVLTKEHHGMFCVRLSIDHQHLLNALIQDDFEWLDTYLEFRQKKNITDLAKAPIVCRFADNADQESILAVGKSAFKSAEFYIGAQHNPKLAQRLKKSWLQNFFQSHQGDAMVVAVQEQRSVGFLQLSKEQTQWSIDILAVAKDAQKQGVAKHLLSFVNQQFGLVSTNTNLANLKAIQFYEDCFFQLQHGYHFLVKGPKVKKEK